MNVATKKALNGRWDCSWMAGNLFNNKISFINEAGIDKKPNSSEMMVTFETLFSIVGNIIIIISIEKQK